MNKTMTVNLLMRVIAVFSFGISLAAAAVAQADLPQLIKKNTFELETKRNVGAQKALEEVRNYPGVVRARVVEIMTDALLSGAPRIQVQLFDDVSVVLERSRLEYYKPVRSFMWRGRISSEGFDEFFDPELFEKGLTSKETGMVAMSGIELKDALLGVNFVLDEVLIDKATGETHRPLYEFEQSGTVPRNDVMEIRAAKEVLEEADPQYERLYRIQGSIRSPTGSKSRDFFIERVENQPYYIVGETDVSEFAEDLDLDPGSDSARALREARKSAREAGAKMRAERNQQIAEDK